MTGVERSGSARTKLRLARTERPTQPTADGGADIVLLSNGNTHAIVECKKYAESRTVGVELVRSLVGACVDWNVRRAYLVTTTGISATARAKASDYRRLGYDIDLVAATELAKLLEVYNSDLPPLGELDVDARRHVISQWSPPVRWRVLRTAEEKLRSLGWRPD